MFKAKQKDGQELANEIRRMSTRPENQRFLRSMAGFGVDMQLPESFRQLLLKMDQTTAVRPALRK